MTPPAGDVLVLATGNAHKVAEVTQILQDLSLTILKPADVGGLPHVMEDGATFHANAAKKAESACAATDRWCLADDSGIEARALDWRPGIHSARYAGPGHDDTANWRKLLEEMAEHRDRFVRFRCVIALARPGAETMFWEGCLEGVCLEAPRGAGGFGYDPVVWLPDRHCTVAELPDNEKNVLSHRARALQGFAGWLRHDRKT